MADPVYGEADLDRKWGPSRPDHRHPFVLDYDRLVHRPAFRRLQGKTQVITPGQADFFRTRLTHTLEVAQLSREIVNRLYLAAYPDEEGEPMQGEWLNLATAVQGSAILHDLGHPPFGHAGEIALCRAVDPIAESLGLRSAANDRLGGFEGNAQSFHLAVSALTRRDAHPGIDLTRTVLDGALKYPWLRGAKDAPSSDRKWCFYPQDLDQGLWVRRGLEERTAKSLEAQIVEWADDVAYAIHDVEDWYKADFLPIEDLRRSAVERDHFIEQVGYLDGYTLPANIGELVEALFLDDGVFAALTTRYDGSHASKETLALTKDALFRRFLEPLRLTDLENPASRHNNSLHIDPELAAELELIKQLIPVYVISDVRMGTAEFGHQRIVTELLQLHTDAAMSGQGSDLRIFPEDTRRDLAALSADSERGRKVRTVVDYVAGMTDAYAIRVHGRLTGSHPGIFNEFL